MLGSLHSVRSAHLQQTLTKQPLAALTSAAAEHTNIQEPGTDAQVESVDSAEGRLLDDCAGAFVHGLEDEFAEVWLCPILRVVVCCAERVLLVVLLAQPRHLITPSLLQSHLISSLYCLFCFIIQVRAAAVGAICELSLRSSDFANQSIEFVVDMLNDEVDEVHSFVASVAVCLLMCLLCDVLVCCPCCSDVR